MQIILDLNRFRLKISIFLWRVLDSMKGDWVSMDMVFERSNILGGIVRSGQNNIHAELKSSEFRLY